MLMVLICIENKNLITDEHLLDSLNWVEALFRKYAEYWYMTGVSLLITVGYVIFPFPVEVILLLVADRCKFIS